MVRDGSIRLGDDHADRYPGADKLATECVLNLIRTTSLITHQLGITFRHYGLTGAGYNVLMILEGAVEPLAPHELARRLLVSRATVTGLLDTLERRSLIARTTDPLDRRMFAIEITDAGRALLAEVWQGHFPAQTQLLSGLSDRQKDTLVGLLGRLQASLEDGAKGAPATSS